MRAKAGWGWVLSLFALLLTTSVAFADARDHFRRGQAAYQQGNYDLAISEWLAGYELEQRPEFQYNLAQAYERLGRLQDAVNSLQRFVESADPDDSSYSDATARLASLQQRLALTGVRVLGGQDGASIFVDGRDWGRLPRPDKISVAPGSHQIVVKLAGFKDFVSNVVIPAGQVIDIQITMEPGSSGGTDAVLPTPGQQTTPVSPGPYVPPPATGTSSRGTSPWLYVGIGASVVTAISLLALIERGSAVKKCEDAEPEETCLELDTIRGQRTLWGVSTVLFGLTAAGSFVLFAMDRGGSNESAGTRATCAPGLLSAACTVRF